MKSPDIISRYKRHLLVLVSFPILYSIELSANGSIFTKYSVIIVLLGAISLGTAIGFSFKYIRYRRDNFHGGLLLAFLYFISTPSADGVTNLSGQELHGKASLQSLALIVCFFTITFTHVSHWFFRRQLFRLYRKRLSPEVIGVRKNLRELLIDILYRQEKWLVPLEGVLKMKQEKLIDKINNHKDAPKRKVTNKEIEKWKTKIMEVIPTIEQSLNGKVELEVYGHN